jgi:serine/threonine-protein kinase
MPSLSAAGDDSLDSAGDCEGGRTSADQELQISNRSPTPADATLPFISESEVQTTLHPTLFFPALPDIGQRYRLECEIARGAMGSVYRGRDIELGREVAVKFLLEQHVGKPEFRRRFLSEARITAQLQHPGIVTVYEAGEDSNGRPHYVMRLVKGQSLARLRRTEPHFVEDRSRFLKVFEKVCEAVAFAHAHGVIHRDLKPANIMVGQFGIVKVMDWGVAKVVPRPGEAKPATAPDDPVLDQMTADDPKDGTQLGRVLGTPAYMSPEQAHAEIPSIDERTDVFALGGILCAILTGEAPYLGECARTVYQKAARADLADAFARLESSGADPELIALCERCLAPDPNDRPRDAGVLGRELTEYLDYDRQRAERDLVRFFDLSPDLFCIAGLNGYFRRVNSNFARVLGHTTKELVSRPFIEFVHPDDRTATLDVLADLNKGFPCVQLRNRYRDVHGNFRWFEWTAKSIPEQGIIFAVARDVTDHVRLENQIRFFEQE